MFLKQTEDFILRPLKIPKIIQEIFVAKSDAHLEPEEFTWLVLLTEKISTEVMHDSKAQSQIKKSDSSVGRAEKWSTCTIGPHS